MNNSTEPNLSFTPSTQAAVEAHNVLRTAVSDLLGDTSAVIPAPIRDRLAAAVRTSDSVAGLEPDLSGGLGEDIRGQLISQARMEYAEDGRIEVDSTALLSVADSHAYVSAWLKVGLPTDC